jgi:hypothetical protein
LVISQFNLFIILDHSQHFIGGRKSGGGKTKTDVLRSTEERKKEKERKKKEREREREARE